MSRWKQFLKMAMPGLLIVPAYALAEDSAATCTATYYQFSDGSGVDIAPSDANHYRWRRVDGTSGLLTLRPDGRWSSTLGWTEQADGTVANLSDCARGKVRFATQQGYRLEFKTTETSFVSDGTRLKGRLVLPVGRGTVPIVVLVHGSENTSALQSYALQRLLPAQGVGVFVYDKRGTGASEGVFTHDLHQLAADARVALRTGKALAGTRSARIGYYGTSQGGWTVPLAAAGGHTDFVIVGYGLAVSPVEEDREALAFDMTRHGFGATEIEKALEVGAAAQAVVRSRFQSGYDALRLVIRKYAGEPWFRFARGNMTGLIVDMPEAALRDKGPRLLAGIIPDYDPMPALSALEIPQLWILGAEDLDAPYLETYRRLLALKARGQNVSVVVYPDVEHGLFRFVAKNDARLSTRQPESLQRLLTTFASGRPLGATYDNARVIR